MPQRFLRVLWGGHRTGSRRRGSCEASPRVGGRICCSRAPGNQRFARHRSWPRACSSQVIQGRTRQGPWIREPQVHEELDRFLGCIRARWRRVHVRQELVPRGHIALRLQGRCAREGLAQARDAASESPSRVTPRPSEGGVPGGCGRRARGWQGNASAHEVGARGGGPSPLRPEGATQLRDKSERPRAKMALAKMSTRV